MMSTTQNKDRSREENIFTSYLSEATRQGEEREIQRYSCLSTRSFYRITWVLNYEIRSAEETVKISLFWTRKILVNYANNKI